MITYLRVLSSSSDIKSYICAYEKNDSAKLLYQEGSSNLDRKIKCLFYIIICFSNKIFHDYSISKKHIYVCFIDICYVCVCKS